MFCKEEKQSCVATRKFTSGDLQVPILGFSFENNRLVQLFLEW